MVYYKHTLERLKGGRYDGADGRNTYWMLGFDKRKTAHELREYLDANAYHAPTNASKAVLMDAVGRHQRGLLSYEKYCTYELLAFCQARNIFAPSRATTPARIARVLEKADDDITFPRFLDLPAELRLKIYELHFSDYRIHTRHRQPPLTLVPRIRAEALPCFCRCATFLWLLTLRHFGFRSDPFGYHFDHYTRRLMEMPADLLAQVRTFHIYWAFVRHMRSGLKCHLNFSVCVSQHNNMKKEFALVMTSRAEKWRLAEDAVRPMLQGQETPLGDITQALQRVQLCAIKSEVNKALRAAWGM